MRLAAGMSDLVIWIPSEDSVSQLNILNPGYLKQAQ